MAGNDRKGIVLQERDHRLLGLFGVLPVADREQIKCVVGFGSTTRANARLLTLTRESLLRRFFLGTTAGGKKAIYALTPRGAKVAGVPCRGPRRQSDTTLVADYFVTHQLAINDVYCVIACRPIPADGARFVRWMHFTEPIGTDAALIPDGYFELASQGRELAAFLEIDFGHESLRVWRKKVEKYVSLALSGVFERQFGQAQFRVLAVANSVRRMESLRTATSAITEKIFWFSTLDEIRGNAFWSPVWKRPKGAERLPLL